MKIGDKVKSEMSLQEIYYQFDELFKPYQGNSKTSVEKLHKIVVDHINSIGNSNPHWNKLNEIEMALRNFYPF